MDGQSPRVLKAHGPRMQQAPRVKRALKPLEPRVNQPVSLDQPIAHRTRPKTKVSVPIEQPVTHRAVSRIKVAENDVVAAIVSDLLAAPVMDEETVEMLEFRQLRSHPKSKKIWDMSYANELGCLCQGVGVKKEDPIYSTTSKRY